MPAPITLPRLDEQRQADLRQRYEEAPDAETRTRYQMLLLAPLGHTVKPGQMSLDSGEQYLLEEYGKG